MCIRDSIWSAWTTVIAKGHNANAPARREVARHLDILRVHQTDQVIHDNVDTILVEGTMRAEAKEVELEALALNHTHVRDVLYIYSSEVRLPRDRAERCKLRALEAYVIVSVCLLYTSPSPRDVEESRMPSSA